MCKTAGVEVNDLASTIRRTQQQIIRGGEDSKGEKWLRRYGESAFDANGHLKDMNEMTLTLSRALKRAQDDGNGMAFILGTMRTASGDAITAIEDAVGNYELSSKIVKNGLANPVLAHEVQGNLNAMALQAGFLNASFESAMLPVANEIVPRLTERMGKLTTLIKDNADLIKDFGKDLATFWGGVENGVDKATDALSVFAKLARENRVVRQSSTEDIVKKYKDDSSVKSAKDVVGKEIANGGYSDEDKTKLIARADLYQKELQRAQLDIKALWAKRREEFAEDFKSLLEKYKTDEDIKTMPDLMNKLTDAEKELIANSPSEFFGSLTEKVGVLNLELKKLRETSAATKEEFLETLNQSNKVGGLRGLKGDTVLDDDVRKKYEEDWKLTRELTDELYKITHNEFENRKFDLDKLASLSGEQSFGKDVVLAGAELEAWVADSLIQSFSRKIDGDGNADLSMKDFETTIKRVVPMGQMRKDEFTKIRSWANENAVSASLSQSAQGCTVKSEEFIGGRKLDF